MKKLFLIGGGIGLGVIAWLAMRKKTATPTAPVATTNAGTALSTDVAKVPYAPQGSVIKTMQPNNYGNTYYDANGSIITVTETDGTDGSKYFTDQNNVSWKITPNNPGALQPWTPTSTNTAAPTILTQPTARTVSNQTNAQSSLLAALQSMTWYMPTSRFATTLNPTAIPQSGVMAIISTIDANGAIVSADGTRFGQLVSPNHIEIYKDAAHTAYANTWYSKTQVDASLTKAIKSPAFVNATAQVAGLKGLTTIKTTI